MPFCTQADTDKLFSILSDYNVEINGNLVFDTLEMNKHFLILTIGLLPEKMEH